MSYVKMPPMWFYFLEKGDRKGFMCPFMFRFIGFCHDIQMSLFFIHRKFSQKAVL